jgi:YidC/Oxa1 family membrane protein insertase
MPERLGYLKDIGLDYGWGPTSMVEWSLEHVHVWSGMPWWASIAATAFLYRLALVPLFMKASENGAKMRAIQPVVKPLNEKMLEALRNGDKMNAMLLRQEMMQVNKTAGVSTIGMLVPSIVQGVFGFCAFRLLRAMANLPVPGLETGGFLWIMDLTETDPYLLLPAIMGGTLHMVLRMGGETGAPMNEAVKPFVLYVFPFIVLLTTAWLPAALNVWLCTTGLMGVCQVHLFQRADVRRMFGLAPMIDPAQAQRDAVAAGLAKEPVKTIDVKAKSSAPRPVYQAPNVKFAASSMPARKTAAAAAAASAETVAQAPQSPLDAVKNKGYGLFNSAGEKWDEMKKAAQDAALAVSRRAGENKPKSKTRSVEYMKQAEEYEKAWKQYSKK